MTSESTLAATTITGRFGRSRWIRASTSVPDIAGIARSRRMTSGWNTGSAACVRRSRDWLRPRRAPSRPRSRHRRRAPVADPRDRAASVPGWPARQVVPDLERPAEVRLGDRPDAFLPHAAGDSAEVRTVRFTRRADYLPSSVRGTPPNRRSGDSARSCDTTEPWPRTAGTSSLCSDGLPGTRGTVGALASTD